MKKKLFILTLFTFLLSCSKRNNQESNIENIFVISFKHPVVTSIPIECGMLPNFAKEGNEGIPEGLEQFIDTILEDNKLLKMIKERISLLKVDTNMKYPGNTQIQCVINYENKSFDLLCLETYGTIYFKGQPMLKDDTLSYLIKKNIGLYIYNKEIIDLFPEYEIFERN